MRTSKLLFGSVILTALMNANLPAQQRAVIKIDLDRRIGKVDPNIYGAFVEPIRNVVYGTIYDPKSPLGVSDRVRPFIPKFCAVIQLGGR